MLARLFPPILFFVTTSFIAFCQESTNSAARDSINHENETFKAIDKSATFPGGMNGFYAYIEKNNTYPKVKKKRGDKAKIHIMFVINRDGSVDQESVSVYTGDKISNQSSSGYIECKGCELEAIRLIKASPKWNPAELDNKPVRQRMVVPVFFSQL